MIKIRKAEYEMFKGRSEFSWSDWVNGRGQHFDPEFAESMESAHSQGYDNFQKLVKKYVGTIITDSADEQKMLLKLIHEHVPSTFITNTTQQHISPVRQQEPIFSAEQEQQKDTSSLLADVRAKIKRVEEIKEQERLIAGE